MIAADLILGDNGDMAAVIDREGKALQPDYMTLDIQGNLILTDTAGRNHKLGQPDRKMTVALKKLENLVLVQMLNEGEEAQADEVPLRVL